MKNAASKWISAAVLVAVLAASAWWLHFREPATRDTTVQAPKTSVAARPAMTVTAVKPKRVEWQTRFDADGSVAAWQEVSISPEVGGFRIADVLVNVGDRVTRGQPLATLATTSVANDLAQQTAAVAEARDDHQSSSAFIRKIGLCGS